MLARVLPVALALLVSSSVAHAQDAPPDSPDVPDVEDAAEAADAAAPAGPTGVAGRLPAGAAVEPVGLVSRSPGKLTLQGLSARLSQARDRGERLRARVNVLKDAILQGGPSADATLVHVNRMGDQFRLIELRYTIDGTVVYAQRDETGSLHEKKTIDILDGPIAPGAHTIKVEMVYRGHGYGPFKYLKKQTFEVEGGETFTATTGKLVEIRALAYERDDTELANRPAVSFKATSARVRPKPAPSPADALDGGAAVAPAAVSPDAEGPAGTESPADDTAPADGAAGAESPEPGTDE